MIKNRKMDRRAFMGKFAATSTGLLAGSQLMSGLSTRNLLDKKPHPGSLPSQAPDFASVREDFPRAKDNLWLANAETHPFNVHTLKALEDYCEYRTLGPGEGRHSFTSEMQQELKQMFADMINVKPEEIAFTMSTTDGENIVTAGLELEKRGGNVVIDDLHFIASKYMYTEMQKKGNIELRVVRHKDWKIRLDDMAKAIDRNTQLVSMALVSNINGYMHDVKEISKLAHANGALVYGDIIQGAGNTPIEAQAMGMDCCACSTYKWLMGDFGLGFLYVRTDLQGDVIKQTRYGLRQVKGMKGSDFEVKPNAARYEGTTTMPYLSGICAYEGLKYITKLGVDNINAHARPLINKLQKEVPPLGFTSITPLDNPTPIVSFISTDMERAKEKLNRAFGRRVVTYSNWQKTDAQGKTETVKGMRIGVSVYNNEEDIDRFLNALEG